MFGKTETQAQRAPSQRRSRRSLFVSSLLLAAILFLVIAFITFRQLRAAEANRMRLLAGFAGQVEATVLDLVQRYVNVVDQERSTALVGERLRDVPNVSLVAGPLTTEKTRRRLDLEARGPRIYLHYETPVPQGVDLDVESARPAALEPPPTTSEGASEEPSRAPTGAGEEARPEGGSTDVMRLYTGLLDLPGTVRPMVIPEAFDLVVLARRGVRRAGSDAATAASEPFTVLFQQGAGELKLADARAAWEVRAPGVWRSLREAWSEGPDLEPTGGGTRVVETRIAGTDYRVFVQPVTLHLRDTEGNPLGPPQEWIACGLISWENLLSSSFTTSPVILFLMVALIPLMLVAWPFLKLSLITRRQAFTRFDAAFLVLSTLVGLSLATLLTLDARFLGQLRGTVDEQLALLGERLETQLYEELGGAAAVLAAVRGPSGEWRERAPELRSVLGGRVLSGDLSDGLRTTFRYPFLHSVFWADREGEQVAKIPFHRDAVLTNQVGDRGYFRCHQRATAPALVMGEGLTAVLDPPPGQPPAESRICLQSIRSKTTAGDLAVLSMAAESSGDPARPDAVVALTTRLASLNRALLAPGFSFAVVNREGVVAFHSDPRRNVNEDFLKATGGDPVLAALLAERREGPLDLHYWGSRYRARVLSLGRLPWALITLRTTQDLRTRNFELIYDFLNPFLLYAIVVGLVLFLGIRYLPGTALRRLLPSRAFTPAYRRIVLWSPAAVGLFALLLASGWPPLILLATLVPQLVLLAAAGRGFFAREEWPPPRGQHKERALGLARLRRLSTLREPEPGDWLVLAGGSVAAFAVAAAGGFDPTGCVLLGAALALAVAYVLLCRSFADRTTEAPYSAALAVMLFAFAMLPALGFFRLAESRQTQLLVQDTQVGLLRNERQRQASLLGDRGELWSRLDGGVQGARRPGAQPYGDRIREFAGETAGSFFSAHLSYAAKKPSEPDGRADPRHECSPSEERSPYWSYGRGTDHAERAWPMRGVSRLLSSRPFPLNDVTAQPLGTDLSRFRHHGVCWRLVGAGSSRTGEPGGAEAGGEAPDPTPRLRAEWAVTPTPTAGAYALVEAVSVPFGNRPLTGGMPPLRAFLSVLAFAGLGLLIVGSSTFLVRKLALVELAPNRRHAAIDKLLYQVCHNGRRAQRYLVRTSLPAAVEQMARGAAFEHRIHVLEFGRLWSDDVKEREAAFFTPLIKEVRPARRRGRGKLPPEFKPKALLITDFRPDLSDLEETDAKIDLLRRLERHGLQADEEEWRGRSVLIVTSRPYHLLTRPDADTPPTDEAEARSRWHAYFARFGQRHARDEGKIEMFESWIAWQQAWLAAGHWPPTRPVGSSAAETPGGCLEPDWFWHADGRVWIEPGPLSTPEATGDERVLEGCEGAFADPPKRRPADWRKRRFHLLLGAVAEECRWTWRLQRFGIDILRELQEGLRQDLERERASAGSAGGPVSGWEPPTAHQLVNRIGLAAQPYYERVWDGCEEGEKRVLYQLARHGVVSPKAFDVVLDLLNKGLVVRTSENPVLRLVNRSFAHFVRRTVRRSEVWRWEEEEGLSAWEIWKWVLPIPLLLLGAFLFMTQQDALSNVVGLVVALASLVPTGVNLYQHFQHLAAEREAAA